MSVDSIEIKSGTRDAKLTGGVLTSNKVFLEVRFTTQLGEGYNYAHIYSTISDSSHKVGLRVTGNDPQDSGLYLEGNQSNTFTGNVEISGRRKHLVLRKTNGAIAVRGDILVKEKAILRFEGSAQLLKTSTITLKTHGAFQTLAGRGDNITNIFKNLIIKDNGVVQFNHSGGKSLGSKYHIYLDDLIISQGGHLKIQGWQDGRDFLLVRKTSANLADALTKMAFVGYNPADIHLRDFNRDYWQISALPEPTTYGAIVATGGLVLAAWQRRRKWPPHG